MGADDRAERLDELDGRLRPASCAIVVRMSTHSGALACAIASAEAVAVLGLRREQLRELLDRLLAPADAATGSMTPSRTERIGLT